VKILTLIIDLIVAYIFFMIFKFEYHSISTDGVRAMLEWFMSGRVIQDGNIYGFRIVLLLGFLIPNFFLLAGSFAGDGKLVFTMCVSILANAIWVLVFLYTFVVYLLFWLW